MSTSVSSLKQGDRVSVPKGGAGLVAFVGLTEFASGTWVGLILDNPNGKNDGSVNGKRYFTCRSSCGMFVRPSQVTILQGTKPTRPTPGPLKLQTPVRASTSTGLPSGRAQAQAGKTNLQPFLATRTQQSSTAMSSRVSSSQAQNSPSATRGPSPATKLLGPTRASTALLPTSPSIATSYGLSRQSSAKLVRGTSRKTSRTSIRGSDPISPSASRRTSAASAAPKRNSNTNALLQHSNTLSRTPSVRSNLMSKNSSSTSNKIPSPGSTRPAPSIASMLSPSHDSQFGNRSETETPSLFEEGTPDELDAVDELEFEETTLGDVRGSESSRAQDHEPEAAPHGDGEASKNASPGGNLAVPVDHFSLVSSIKPSSVVNKTPSRNFNEGNTGSPYSNAVPFRVHEELLTRYKLMEGRRNEDREKIRELEKAKEENEDWINVLKPKLQEKLNDCLEEIKALKKMNKELEVSRQDAEGRLADFSDEVELATLDKEMAEERLDQTESAMVAMKEELESLKVELGSLKEIQERIEAGDDEETDKSVTLKLIQMEKQNQRLKEALTRMRDVAHETEQVNRKKIADLEQELDLSAELQVEYSLILKQLEVAESQVEELKQQLDASMGAEDMLEQLAERNLTLNEKIDDMKIIIEDLEALKELADELEENHVETEKQMQDEIDFKDLQLREQKKRNEVLEESVADYENTILQFRELVLSLQTDLDTMRERQQIQNHESQNLASQTQAMLNLNRKLQNSSVKGQVKAIDLELRKLESTQAMLQCTIMKPYLLPSYFEGDHDAVESLLFFTRLAAKTNLVSTVIEQTNNISESLSSTVTEVVVVACETRSKLARLSALSSRFAAFIRSCPPANFIKMGGVYQELILVERKIDVFIDACKKDELKEGDVGREIERFLPQMRHLVEIYLADSEYDVAELQFGEINTLDVDLDSILACIGFAKQTIATLEKEGQTSSSEELSEYLFLPLQNLLNQARTAKVISRKLLRCLQDLMQQSCYLNPNHSNAITVLKENTYDLANVSSRLADLVGRYSSELRSSKETFQLETYNDIVQEATRDIVKHSGKPLEEFFTLLSHLSRDLGITLGVASDPEHNSKNFYEHPWFARVAEMRSSAAMNVDAELKVSKLNEEIRELHKEVRAKEHSLQESQVKIQVMEKRMEAVKRQADAMAELESNLKKAEKEAKQYEELNESIQIEYEKMAEQNKSLKVKLAGSGGDLSKPLNAPTVASSRPQASVSSGQDFYVPYEGNLETAQLIEQVESLRGAARFLRSENSYLKSQGLMKQLNTLPSYSVLPPAFPPTLEESDSASLPPSPGFEKSPAEDKQRAALDPSDLLRKFAIESKRLYKEALNVSASPKVIDLTAVKRPPLEPSAPGTSRVKVWQHKGRLPQAQLERRKEEVERLQKKVEALKQKTHQISI